MSATVETQEHAFLEYCTLLDQYMEVMCQLNDAMRDVCASQPSCVWFPFSCFTFCAFFPNILSHKQGFIHLAKAQYTMGHDAVSPLMFDMKMNALRTVSLSVGADSRVAVESHAQSAASRKEDPLYWYGALPCPALRSAQTSFSSAADLVAQLAQLRMNMSASASTFGSLPEQK